MVFIIHTLNRKLLAGNIVEEVFSNSPPSTEYRVREYGTGEWCRTSIYPAVEQTFTALTMKI
jgi:hypothetical protein